MQAYASAHLTPLESELRVAPAPSINLASGPAGIGANGSQLDASSPVAALVSVILDGLSERDLGLLARRLLPHLRQPEERNNVNAAYTVASLAASWLRSSEEPGGSSQQMPSASGRHRQTRRRVAASPRRRERCVPAPKAAGPSLRSVLSAASASGGRR